MSVFPNQATLQSLLFVLEFSILLKWSFDLGSIIWIDLSLDDVTNNEPSRFHDVL